MRTENKKKQLNKTIKEKGKSPIPSKNAMSSIHMIFREENVYTLELRGRDGRRKNHNRKHSKKRTTPNERMRKKKTKRKRDPTTLNTFHKHLPRIWWPSQWQCHSLTLPSIHTYLRVHTFASTLNLTCVGHIYFRCKTKDMPYASVMQNIDSMPLCNLSEKTNNKKKEKKTHNHINRPTTKTNNRNIWNGWHWSRFGEFSKISGKNLQNLRKSFEKLTNRDMLTYFMYRFSFLIWLWPTFLALYFFIFQNFHANFVAFQMWPKKSSVVYKPVFSCCKKAYEDGIWSWKLYQMVKKVMKTMILFFRWIVGNRIHIYTRTQTTQV